MSFKVYTYWYLVFLFIVVGCKSDVKSSELNALYTQNESAFKKSKQIGEFQIGLVFYHPAYLAILNDDIESLKKIINSKNQLEMQNFTFSLNYSVKNREEIWKYNLDSESEYYERIQYLTSGINEDIKLIVNKKDTLNCLFSHLERNYGIGKTDQLLISFESKSPINLNEMEFQIEDKIFDLGRIHFNYSRSNILAIPKITI